MTEKRNPYLKDLPQEAADDVWSMFGSDAAAQRRQARCRFISVPKLVLPDETAKHTSAAFRRGSEYEVAVEFRHGSWLDKNRERTLKPCEMKVLRTQASTRHGRRRSTPCGSHFRHGGRAFHDIRPRPGTRVTWGVLEHLYNEDELKEWVPKIKDLASEKSRRPCSDE